ncbi:MAG: hypothetical protein IT579_19970 [Verrucomicrobia subdivision 3 bacterium]|nr:hypothetical protein [Limisphaerales bacterium]
MPGAAAVASSDWFSEKAHDCRDDLINALCAVPVAGKIRLDIKWARSRGRLDLNLTNYPGNSYKPDTVVIRAWMGDLQLGTLNAGNSGLQTLNDLVNVSRHGFSR